MSPAEKTASRANLAARASQATLEAIRESIQSGQEWLLPGRSNGHPSTQTALRTIDRLAKAAGIQEVSPRKKLSRRKVTPPYPPAQARVVSALMSGMPLPTVQKQVGHKRLSTTEIYATVAPALVKEAYEMRRFGPLGRSG